MAVNVQELYRQTVLPLPERARLALASLILQDISQGVPEKPRNEKETRQAEARFVQWIGAVSSGNPRSADNEQIDIDLAHEYGATHDDEN